MSAPICQECESCKRMDWTRRQVRFQCVHPKAARPNPCVPFCLIGGVVKVDSILEFVDGPTVKTSPKWCPKRKEAAANE